MQFSANSFLIVFAVLLFTYIEANAINSEGLVEDKKNKGLYFERNSKIIEEHYEEFVQLMGSAEEFGKLVNKQGKKSSSTSINNKTNEIKISQNRMENQTNNSFLEKFIFCKNKDGVIVPILISIIYHERKNDFSKDPLKIIEQIASNVTIKKIEGPITEKPMKKQ